MDNKTLAKKKLMFLGTEGLISVISGNKNHNEVINSLVALRKRWYKGIIEDKTASAGIHERQDNRRTIP